MKMSPCATCDHRTITCHGVCKEYEAWKIENDNEKDWLKAQRPAPPEGARKAMTEKIKARARGWYGKRGTKDYG